MHAKESNIVRLTIDLDAPPPPMSEEQKARLDAIAAMPDSEIDYSDAPYRPDAVWTRAVRLPRAKKQITLRIDADVLDFFKSTGARYQSRMNAVLRAYFDAQKLAPAQ